MIDSLICCNDNKCYFTLKQTWAGFKPAHAGKTIRYFAFATSAITVMSDNFLQWSYYFLIFTHVAIPMMPRNSPLTDAPHEKKFRKKVDSNI